VVFRRDKGGPSAWTKLGEVASTTYGDKDVVENASYVYRVVARSLKTTGSGTFYLHSPGRSVEHTYFYSMGTDDAGPLTDGGASPAADPVDEAGCGCRTSKFTTNGDFVALAALTLARLRRRR